MEFKYKINPLATQVLLDDKDVAILRLSVQLHAAQEYIALNIMSKNHPDKAESYVRSMEYYRSVAYPEENEEHKVDKDVQDYVEALAGIHLGDCTCVPATCLKCRAEGLLGIDTLEGLWKHPASYIFDAFWPAYQETPLDQTAEEAFAKLSAPISKEKPDAWAKYSQEKYESYIPGWEKEKAIAASWYKRYCKEKLGVEV